MLEDIEVRLPTNRFLSVSAEEKVTNSGSPALSILLANSAEALETGAPQTLLNGRLREFASGIRPFRVVNDALVTVRLDRAGHLGHMPGAVFDPED